jgi:hypothetical protein
MADTHTGLRHPTLAELYKDYSDRTRNMSFKMIHRIENSEITLNERSESPLIDGACKAWDAFIAAGGKRGLMYHPV